MATFFINTSLACEVTTVWCALYRDDVITLTSALMDLDVSVPVKARMLRNESGSCNVMSPLLSLAIKV